MQSEYERQQEDEERRKQEAKDDLSDTLRQEGRKKFDKTMKDILDKQKEKDKQDDKEKEKDEEEKDRDKEEEEKEQDQEDQRQKDEDTRRESEKDSPEETKGEKDSPEEAKGEKDSPEEAKGEKDSPEEAKGEKDSPEEAKGESSGSKGEGGEGSSSSSQGSSVQGSSASSSTAGGAEASTATGSGVAAEETAAVSGAAGSGAGASGAAGGAGAAAGGAAAGSLAAVLAIVLVVILILFILIGMISFVVSGLGVMGEKIEQISTTIWIEMKKQFLGDAEATVNNEQVFGIAEYIEEMGFDLEGFGFLESNGKQVTVEETEESDEKTETIKNSDEEVILKRTNGKIEELKSKYIFAYLVADNRTYLIRNDEKSWFKNYLGGGLFATGPLNYLIGTTLYEQLVNEESKIGRGMIFIDGYDEENSPTDEEGWLSGLWNGFKSTEIADLFRTTYEQLLSNIEIDRETKKLIISKKENLLAWDTNVYAYSLEGWTGRYGLSLEFLLSLHLATMAPDFAYDVATKEEFASDVKIRMHPVRADITLGTYENGVFREFDTSELTEEEKDAIETYKTNNMVTYVPYIISVENHWYKNLSFEGCYTEIFYDDENATEDQKEMLTRVYEYEGTQEVDDGDILGELVSRYKLKVREIRKNDVVQIKEPTQIDNSGTIKSMLLGAETTEEDGKVSIVEGTENTVEDYIYYKYNGSSLEEGKEERDKDYIIKKMELGEGEGSINYMDTSMFNAAFAILESVNSEDAEFILRDLKQLFYELGISFEEGVEETNVEPLTWIMPGYTPVKWVYPYETGLSQISIEAESKGSTGYPWKTGEEDDEASQEEDNDSSQNEEPLEIVAPANANVTVLNSGEEDGNSIVRLELVDPELEGIYIYISGFDETVGTYVSAGDKLGVVNGDTVKIIMTDKDKSPITLLNSYLVPPEIDDGSDTKE